MTSSLLMCVLMLPAAAQDKVPDTLELFAKEAFYKSQKGEEKAFVGVLMRVDKKGGGIGIGRFNPYYLEMATSAGKVIREVYGGGKPDVLAPYVGKTVRVTGKAVDLEVTGKVHKEIWPARLEVVPSTKKADARSGEELTVLQGGGMEPKIHAKAPWRYASARPDGPKEGHKLILRSAAQLVAATPFKDRDAPQQVVEKQATAELAKALKVDTIDWSKQMLVVVTAGVKPTGGWTIDIASLKVSGKALDVHYKITAPKGFVTQAFTHPGVVALVDRFEGEAKFMGGVDPAKPPRDPRDLPPPPLPPVVEKPAQDAKELKIFAHAPGRGAAGSRLIRSDMELATVLGIKDVDAASAQIAKQLKVDKIDWKTQMLVFVSGGTQRSGGYSVQVQKLAVSDKTLTVHWKLNTPKPGQPVTLALTHPAAIVLAERFEGEVRFDPLPPKGGLDRK